MGAPVDTSSVTTFPDSSFFGIVTGRPSPSMTGAPEASTAACIATRGCTGVTFHPIASPMAATAITIAARMTKMSAGSGSLLPTHSIQSSTERRCG